MNFGGEYGAGYNEFRYWLRNAPEGNAEIAAPQELSSVRQDVTPTNIPTQIRELAELRDAGAISQEEFETKKKDLLDRM